MESNPKFKLSSEVKCDQSEPFIKITYGSFFMFSMLNIKIIFADLFVRSLGMVFVQIICGRTFYGTSFFVHERSENFAKKYNFVDLHYTTFPEIRGINFCGY
jgi:hypothetical protein